MNPAILFVPREVCKKKEKSNGLKWNIFNTFASAIHALSRRGSTTERREPSCWSQHAL